MTSQRLCAVHLVFTDVELLQNRSRSLGSLQLLYVVSESLFPVWCTTGNCCLQLPLEGSRALGDFRAVRKDEEVDSEEVTARIWKFLKRLWEHAGPSVTSTSN